MKIMNRGNVQFFLDKSQTRGEEERGGVAKIFVWDKTISDY